MAQRPVVIGALGLAQIVAWGSSYYMPAVMAVPIASETGWPLPWVSGGLSCGLLVASLASPAIGRHIERRGGRLPMAASGLLMAAGLAVMTQAPNLAVFLAAWLVIGLGMGCGLYDATFATLGRMYGTQARGAISALTLIAGFANTVCWPLSAYLLHRFGWRGGCLVWAAADLLLLLPTYLLVLPRSVPPPPPGPALAEGGVRPAGLGVFVLMAAVTTLGNFISATLSVHLLTLLAGLGLAASAAVAFGAMLGPSQVGGRLVEILSAHTHHPVWTLFASTALIALGIGLLWVWPGAVPVALGCYGAGVGIGSIARGTVPMALFGPRGYAARMGRLALPGLLSQAAAPVAGALLIQSFGAAGSFGVLAAAAVLDVALTVALLAASRPQRRAARR